MYDRILIPVDGSDEAKRAARYGLEFACAFDTSVDVVHVLDRRSRRLTRTKSEQARLRERGESILEEIEEIAADLGRSVTTAAVSGVPAIRIVEYAADRGAGLIVMGRRGETSLEKRLLGGVTEGVLYQGDTHVLVVPNEGQSADIPLECSRVLIPTDGSENAAVAAAHGIRVARRFDSNVHVLNIVDLQAAGGAFNAGGLEAAFVERLEAAGEDAVGATEAEVTETAPELDVSAAVVRTTAFEGVAAGIREYVADAGIDIIVMASHGRSNLKRQLLGSVASNVLRTVDVPVLIVKRAA